MRLSLFKLPFLLFYFLLIVLDTACQKHNKTTSEQVKEKITLDFLSLSEVVQNQLLPLATHSSSTDSLQKAFLVCRKAYKQVEFASEYYFATTSRFINGPPLDEIETTESEVLEPEGLQVIEEYLFPAFDTAQRANLVLEVRKLQASLKKVEVMWEVNDVSDRHIFDAFRLEILRIITLGISGFDTPLSKNAIQEAAVSLAAMREIIPIYQAESDSLAQEFQTLDKLLQEADNHLSTHTNFDSFDRAYFITTYANPLSTQLLEIQVRLNLKPINNRRALRWNAKTIFDKAAFNADYYAPNPDLYKTDEKIELGKKLFYDPILSSANSRSCASCHFPEKAFTDGLPKSPAVLSNKFIKRNTPTLINAALQNGLFYDFRSSSLEHQAMDVVQNADEMHGSLEDAVKKLAKDDTYMKLFKKAFPIIQDTIQPLYIQNAIASYMRSLLAMNSRFDQYMRGDHTKMNQREVKGFTIYMGKAKCGTCHFMPLFNGTLPPNFDKTESEVIGVPADAMGRTLDTDLGRYEIHKFDQFKYAFKTPTLRNIALTAPYMHNGVYQTLEEVVEFYNKGGGVGLGLNVPNQTLPSEPLHLTKQEKQDLIAFMRTLTDTTGTTSRPERLPAFPGNANLANRKVGGTY